MIVVTLRDELNKKLKPIKRAEIIEINPTDSDAESQLVSDTYTLRFADFEVREPYLYLKNSKEEVKAIVRFDLLQNLMIG